MKARGPRTRTLTVIAANSALALGYASGLVSAPAGADNWLVTPSVSVRETYTTNANYAPPGHEQSSFVTSATAGVRVNGNGARAQLNGFAALQGVVYLGEYNDNNRNNSAFVRANLLGSVEPVEEFLSSKVPSM